MAEIRLDMLRPAMQDIPAIFSEHGGKMIATCRPGYHSDAERMDLLKAAIEMGCAYIDLEIDASYIFLDTMIPYAKEKGCKVILSYHNVKITPDKEALELIIIECSACGADIVKIASMVNEEQDAARLLALYAHHKNVLAIGMGEKGKITRLAALKLGAPFSYVSPDGYEQTAPGQLSENEMRALLRYF
jgi:3-dehydroquinate dehydratase-1